MTSKSKLKIGILGCGTIGSGIAKSIKKDLNKTCQIKGLFDTNPEKTLELSKILSSSKLIKKNIEELIKDCDFIVEAVNAQNTRPLIRECLRARKNVLAMSVGKLLNSTDLFNLAKKNNCSLLIPSGAIAGIDAVKAASLVGIDKITLTTRKPPKGFLGNIYLGKKGVKLSKIKKETILFQGSVDKAVHAFPQNINVAATLALASKAKSKLIIKIITSPLFKINSHEILLTGKFGKLTSITENVPSPDNPKTSFLAVLSGIQTIKQFSEKIFIGT